MFIGWYSGTDQGYKTALDFDSAGPQQAVGGKLSTPGTPSKCHISPLPSQSLHAQDPKILKLLHLKQNFCRNTERAILFFLTEDHGHRFGGSDPCPKHFTLSCCFVLFVFALSVLWPFEDYINIHINGIIINIQICLSSCYWNWVK